MSYPISWETVATISSAIIALCALFATFYQAGISRKHNQLSVTPYLTTWETVLDEYIVFTIHNNGVGPARINSFNIFVDGQKILGEKLEPHEKCLKIIFPEYQFDWYGSYLGIGYMMPVNQEKVLVGIKFISEKIPTKLEFEHRIKRVQVLIEYESIYEKRFKYDSIEELKRQSI